MAIISLTLHQQSETSVKLNHDTFDIVVDRPEAQGGGSKGLMGGQYMLTGIGGCFCSTLFAAAQARDIVIEGLKVTVNATLSEDLPKRFTAITLDTSYERCNQPEEFDKLLAIAEQGCISVNTAKNGLDFNVTHN